MTQLITSLSTLLARDLLYESTSRQQRPDAKSPSTACSVATATTPASSTAAAKDTPTGQQDAHPHDEAAYAKATRVSEPQDDREEDDLLELPATKEDRFSFSSHAKLRSSIVTESSLMPEAEAVVEEKSEHASKPKPNRRGSDFDNMISMDRATSFSKDRPSMRSKKSSSRRSGGSTES